MLDLNGLSGLDPKLWICVEGKYSREDIKTYLLSCGISFVSNAVTNLQALSVQLINYSGDSQVVKPENILGSLVRQETLKQIFLELRFGAHQEKFPELRRLKRNRGFFRKLDQTLQKSRMTFSHWEEEEVFNDFLNEKIGNNPRREEVRIFARLYEAWLQQHALWDLPLLLRKASEVLSQGWPEKMRKPDRVLVFSSSLESLEEGFYQNLGDYTIVERVDPDSIFAQKKKGSSWSWERWHTLDSAVDSMVEQMDSSQEVVKHYVLIPGASSERRILDRSFADAQLPLADPRDPLKLKKDEELKNATLPLRVVGRGYDRQDVLDWLKTERREDLRLSQWITQISENGIKKDLRSYQVGDLSSLHAELEHLEKTFGDRKVCADFSEAHLRYLNENDYSQEVIQILESCWSDFVSDLSKIGIQGRKAPALFWLQGLVDRLEQMHLPPEPLRSREGVFVYRFQQAPPLFLLQQTQVVLWLVSLPVQISEYEKGGDYWYSERERESLSVEFNVQSSIKRSQELLENVKLWTQVADQVNIMDAHYSELGKENESILPALKELRAPQDIEIEEKGIHPRWRKSFEATFKTESWSSEVRLSPFRFEKIRASELDRYSRCAFQALGAYRWSLRDYREAGYDLWPDIRGIILHKAVEILVSSYSKDFTSLPSFSECVDSAWSLKKPKGLLFSPQMEEYHKSRMVKILEAFYQKEKEYLKRSGARVLSLEEREGLSLEIEGVRVQGIPDRIDEIPGRGVLVIDYKTSSALPSGKEMVDLGVFLQLPFYALASKQKYGQECVGLQFVELNLKAGRSKGIFFQQDNGKGDGKIIHTRSKLNVFEEEPQELWSRVETHVRTAVNHLKSGCYDPQPKLSRECRSCLYSDLCSLKRRDAS